MNTTRRELPPLRVFASAEEEPKILVEQIRRKALPGRPLLILEAGCGNSWQLQPRGVRYVLTGVDVNQRALDIRTNQRKDLDEPILGDLRTVSLEPGKYDVVYSSFVLEHLQDAQRVLDNFCRWLRPGGILILRIPDPRSVYGFLSKHTPFFVHVLYKRYIAGSKTAGKVGYDPFPTVYEQIVSRQGIHQWSAARGMKIKEELGWDYRVARPGIVAGVVGVLVRALRLLSLGTLAADHVNLTYVIEKPQEHAALPAAGRAAQPSRATP